jgi:hypothetical protein
MSTTKESKNNIQEPVEEITNIGFAEKVCGTIDTRRKGEAVY